VTRTVLVFLLGLFSLPAFPRPWADIHAAGEISACANPNALPYAADREELPGFQIEIARALASELGVRLHTAWIIPRLRASTVDCDLLMDTILVPGVQPPSLKTSIAYQLNGVALAFAPGRTPVQAYRDHARGTRVGVLHNSVASLVVSRTPATMVPFGFEDDMLAAAAKGEIDACAVSVAAAGFFNARHAATRLTVAHAEDSEPELRWPVGIGMRRADEALVERVNAALAKLLSSGTIAAIYGRYGIEHRRPQP
jgi:polar amino acid transport system substrate-binding protein